MVGRHTAAERGKRRIHGTADTGDTVDHTGRPAGETEADGRRRTRLGIAVGIAMAFGAASSFSVARGGILHGVRPEDITLLRFFVAGLIFLPFVLWRGIGNLAGIGWGRGLLLTLTAGPFAAFLQVGGYVFAPLAHGAVLVPMSVTVFCSVVAVVLLKERHGPTHVVGTFGILAGLTLIGGEGLMSGGAGVWIGDLMFIASGALWASYTILFRYWRLDAVAGIAVVSVLSLGVMLVVYPLFFSVPHLLALPLNEVLLQGLTQGLLSGTLSTIAYNWIVVLLGAGRAVLFPALVPGLAILFGIPILGETPTLVQLLGLASAMIGLLVALGILRWPWPR
ncbi:MAG: DMT family transporter [Alphaproteobacteria bacterium]|nr:DMT family transporter [Alphaproteobacteria bacterium]